MIFESPATRTLHRIRRNHSKSSKNYHLENEAISHFGFAADHMEFLIGTEYVRASNQIAILNSPSLQRSFTTLIWYNANNQTSICAGKNSS